jgi:hypothetical protein
MVRNLLVALFACFWAVSATAYLTADDKPKGDTLVGKLVCSKCTLGETPKCGHALKVKVNDKETIYYIKDEGAKEPYHKTVCPADKEADAKVAGGKIVESDGKKWIEGGKVELVK